MMESFSVGCFVFGYIGGGSVIVISDALLRKKLCDAEEDLVVWVRYLSYLTRNVEVKVKDQINFFLS